MVVVVVGFLEALEVPGEDGDDGIWLNDVPDGSGRVDEAEAGSTKEPSFASQTMSTSELKLTSFSMESSVPKGICDVHGAALISIAVSVEVSW